MAGFSLEIKMLIEGGTGNSAWGNKFDNTDDLP